MALISNLDLTFNPQFISTKLNYVNKHAKIKTFYIFVSK